MPIIFFGSVRGLWLQIWQGKDNYFADNQIILFVNEKQTNKHVFTINANTLVCESKMFVIMAKK